MPIVAIPVLAQNRQNITFETFRAVEHADHSAATVKSFTEDFSHLLFIENENRLFDESGAHQTHDLFFVGFDGNPDDRGTFGHFLEAPFGPGKLNIFRAICLRALTTN